MNKKITKLVADDGTVFNIQPEVLLVKQYRREDYESRLRALKNKVDRHNKAMAAKAKRALKPVPTETMDKLLDEQKRWNLRHRLLDLHDQGFTLEALGRNSTPKRTREAVRQHIAKAKRERTYNHRSPMEKQAIRPRDYDWCKMNVNLLNAKFKITSET